VLLAGQASAEDPGKALARIDVAMKSRQAQLQALHRELESLADPGLAAAESIMLIADWGRQAKDAEPALAALQAIAEAAKGTPVGRLALREAAKLLAGKKRQDEAVHALTRLAVEAVKQGGPSAGEAGHVGEARLREWEAQLRAQEAALTAKRQQLEEEAQRLKEYALGLKAEEEKVRGAAPARPPAGGRGPGHPVAAPGDTGAAPAVGEHPPAHPEEPPAGTR
jgi:hypothetical protein